jgi:Asp-tRNA(Asn)/Glu-tRNA(Gln) amidotransferase A subunit family amidase
MSAAGTSELAFTPALELAARIRAREISPIELTELYLARIERLDPQLNSFVHVDAEGALAAARQPREGPFAGVPIPIKDLTDVAGLPTTYSAKAFARNVPAADAAVVRRIREAGFVVLGKTNTPEFGTIGQTESELNGPCRNPWDLERTPGGSSGGAAAATAAALCPIAHGTDGGGSIRNPASCCGLVGIKPSRGRVSPAPYVPGSLGLGTSGPIARTVRDAAALLDVMSGRETGDFFVAPEPERPFLAEAERPPGRLRVAVTVEPPIEVAVDPACAAAASSAAELLSELGHEVVEAAPPWRSAGLLEHFIRVWQSGPATAGVEDLSVLEPINRALAQDAFASSQPDHVMSVMALQHAARALTAFWEEVDVVVTPTLALPPVPIGWTWEDTDGDPHAAFARQLLFTPFTPVVNVTGQPAVSLPLHWSEQGLPIGVQLIGGVFAEATLVRLAAQLEEARPWSERRPRLEAFAGGRSGS